MERIISNLLLHIMLWCASRLGFNLIVFPKGEYVNVIHLAQSEVALERSMRDYLADEPPTQKPG